MHDQELQDEIDSLKEKDHSLPLEMDYYIAKSLLIPQVLIFLLLLWWAYKHIILNTHHIFLSWINFFTHESGHFIFAFFGQFMRVLGGNLFETLVPLVLCFFCLYKRWYFSSGIFLFWVGNTLIDASIYIADARARVLPLVIWTGTRSTSDAHDWTYILTDLNLIHQDLFIASIVQTTGKVFLSIAIILSLTAFIISLKHVLLNNLQGKNKLEQEVSVYH